MTMILKTKKIVLHSDIEYDQMRDFIKARNSIDLVQRYLNRLVEGIEPSNVINNESVMLLTDANKRMQKLYNHNSILSLRNSELELINFRKSQEIKALNELITKK